LGAVRSEMKIFGISMLFGDLPAAYKRQIGPEEIHGGEIGVMRMFAP